MYVNTFYLNYGQSLTIEKSENRPLETYNMKYVICMQLYDHIFNDEINRP